MKPGLSLSCLAMLAAMAEPASARTRPDSLRMTCAQTAFMVQRAGASVSGTGPNIYDRFVVNGNFCFREQYILPAWIRVADTPRCFVGYRCVDFNPFFD